MGAWGHGPFENDDASDWVWELEESKDFSAVQLALETVTRPGIDYIEAPDCSIAIAAAEVIAASQGRSAPNLLEEASVWVADRGAPPKQLVALARQALAAIKSRSELRDLWEESESFDEWVQSLAGIEARLAG